MTKQELYEKLGGIYGGQKELIEDVVNAFNNLQEIADVYDRKYREVKLLKEQILFEKEDKKVLQKKIDKAKEFLDSEYNTYPSAKEWRNALKKILLGEDYE